MDTKSNDTKCNSIFVKEEKEDNMYDECYSSESEKKSHSRRKHSKKSSKKHSKKSRLLMKIARDLLTLALAVSVATVILVFLPMPETSYYGSMPPTLSQGPLDDSQDKSLVAVGLLAKKSVMDGPSKEIKPTQAPPTVPEHVVPPAPQMPKVVEKVESDVKASITKSAEMTGVPKRSTASPPRPKRTTSSSFETWRTPGFAVV